MTYGPRRGKDTDVEKRFNELRAVWERDTRWSSDLNDYLYHPAYREIISMGWDAVPLIIDRLRVSPDHWFTALVEITGKDRAAGAMTVGDAAQLWVSWYDNQDFTPDRLNKLIADTKDHRQTYFKGWRLSDSEGALWDWFWKNQDRIRSMMEKDTE